MTDYRFKPKISAEDHGWYGTRLPHFDGGQQTQFITFRLDDSVPQVVLDKWRRDCKSEAAFRKRIENFLDSGYGKCWLRNDAVASIVRDSILFWNGKKCAVHAWVIMPNHAHILMSPLGNNRWNKLMHSIKSYTANEANKLLGLSGQFWQHDSFDRYIRDQRHYAAVVRYIHNNPVSARLCVKPGDWPYSSAAAKPAP